MLPLLIRTSRKRITKYILIRFLLPYSTLSYIKMQIVPPQIILPNLPLDIPSPWAYHACALIYKARYVPSRSFIPRSINNEHK